MASKRWALALKHLENASARLDSSLLETVFEPAIEEQCLHADLYSADLNYAVLKLYALDPLSFNFDVVKLILAKSLMMLPKDHFTVAFYTIPRLFYSPTGVGATPNGSNPISRGDETDNAVGEALSPGMQNLVLLETRLRSCCFEEFWALIRKEPSVSFINDIDGFKPCLRRYIAHVIAQAHKNIDIDSLAAMVNYNPRKDMKAILSLFPQWRVKGQWLVKVE